MFKLPKEARKIGKDSTHGSVMPKHLVSHLGFTMEARSSWQNCLQVI
jgi:hypothetical protein